MDRLCFIFNRCRELRAEGAGRLTTLRREGWSRPTQPVYIPATIAAANMKNRFVSHGWVWGSALAVEPMPVGIFQHSGRNLGRTFAANEGPANVRGRDRKIESI